LNIPFRSCIKNPEIGGKITGECTEYANEDEVSDKFIYLHLSDPKSCRLQAALIGGLEIRPRRL
jgi:hypothetical protein